MIDHESVSSPGLIARFQAVSVAFAIHAGLPSRTSSADVLTCPQPGELRMMIATGLNAGGAGSLTLTVGSHEGIRDFLFASGTTAPNIAIALNAFSAQTGVNARVDEFYPYCVYLASRQTGATHFVSVQQIGGDHGIICTMEEYICESSGIDFGVDGVTGDATCDGHVGIADLIAVVTNWENCSLWPCVPTPDSCPADVNQDSAINVSDLLTVIANWGQNG